MSSLHSNSISVWSIVFNTVEQEANMNLTHDIFCALFPHQRSLFTYYLHAGCCTQRRLSCGSCNSHALSVNLVRSHPLVRFRCLFCRFGDSRALSATLVCSFGDSRAVSATVVRFRRLCALTASLLHFWGLVCGLAELQFAENFETDGSSNSLSFSLKHLCTFRRVSCTFGHSRASPEEFKFARIFMLIDESANSPFAWLVSLMFYRALFKILNSPRLSNPLKFGPSGKPKHRQESDKNNKSPVNYRLRKTKNQRKQKQECY